MNFFRRLSLRWRLVLAFFLVSAPPVLISSYMAATFISGVFQRNIDHWMEETARFLANDVEETKNEADKSASIIASTLHRAESGQNGVIASYSAPFASLLASVGYDYVQIYDENDQIVYDNGNVDFISSRPKENKKSLFQVNIDGHAALIGGAVRTFQADGKRYFILVADKVDEAFYNSSQATKSLDIAIFHVEKNGWSGAGSEERGLTYVPKRVFQALQEGRPSAISIGHGSARIVTAYASLRDNDGLLVGILACRVAGMAAMFENMDEWQYFIGLAAIAGVLSILVGALVARWISRPVQALNLGLRQVAAGDYQGRLHAAGGRELSELASGFNLMSEQLERLRSMEAAMRRREQLAALGEAAAVIAHEIRNPLGIINTSSQVIRMKANLKPSEDKLISFILDEVARIDSLVQEVLDFVRPKELNKRPVNLNRDVLEKVFDFAAPEMDRRKLTATFAGREQDIRLMADADMLYQAMLNLILNAIEATPEGGSIGVAVDRRQDMIEIRIEDSGEGIDPAIIGRIFDPFFTTKAKGTGLGLAQARSAVEEHGGTIECESEPGKGTVFVIRLNEMEAETP